MADNVGYTPGTGAVVAADDIGGVLYQRAKMVFGADGSASDVSTASPLPVTGYGELMEAIEAIRRGINVLANNIGAAYADSGGRLRVWLDSGATHNINTVNAVTTVSTVTNQSQIGGRDAYPVVVALMTMAADGLRRNITVS